MSIKLRLNPRCGRRPPGGWKVVHDGHAFEAEDFEELVGKIDQYRRSNRIGMGSVREKLEAYFVGRWPHLGKRVAEADGEEDDKCELVDQLNKDCMAYLNECMSETFNLDFAPMVIERAKTCAACPYNQPVVIDDEEDEEVIARSVVVLTRARQDEIEKYGYKLGVCLVHRHHNGVAVWKSWGKDMPEPAADQPAECWHGKR